MTRLASDPVNSASPRLCVIGLNHRTAPITLREKLHFDGNATRTALGELLQQHIFTEACILSTCNRVEIYGLYHGSDAVAAVCQFLSGKHHLPSETISPHLYYYDDLSAIHHGFRVTSSLDSLVLGEPQISGQVKDAYRLAMEADTLGFYLSKYFNRAFFVGKRVRSETRIGAGAVSVGYAACELGRQIFGTLEGRRVLIIGAGEMGERIAEHLVAQNLSKLLIANRSADRAHALKERFGGEVIPLDQCLPLVHEVDIVMSSISVDDPLWKAKDLEPFLKDRDRPLFIIDVAVPRSLDSGLNALNMVYLYNIDDLEKAIARNQEERQEEARKAELIIEEEAQAFHKTMDDNAIAPTISSLSQKLHDIKDHELARTFKRLQHLSPEDRDAFNRCADAMINKILHMPILQLKTHHKTASEGSKVRHFIETLSALFNLD